MADVPLKKAHALLAPFGWPQAGRFIEDQLRFRSLGWITIPKPLSKTATSALRRARTLARAQQAAQPARAEAFLLEAAAAYWLGDAGAAMGVCRTAARREPEDPLPRLWLANLSLAQGDPDGALRAAQAALALRKSAWGLCLQAEALFALKRAEAALACVRAALALEPRRPWALVLLSEIHRERQRFDEALDALTRLVRYHRHPWAYVLRARTRFNFRDRGQGLADLDRALELSPGMPEARAFRAEAYRRMGRLEESLREFDAVLKKHPRATRVRSWRGAVLLELGRYREAIADFSANIDEEKEANIAWALSQRARARLALGQYSLAVEDMNRAARINPKSGWVYGGENGTLERHGEIVARFTKALRRQPDWAWGYAWRGETRLRAGQAADALVDLDRAVALAPALAWAWAWRGLAKEALGDGAGAAADYDRAITLDGRYPAVLGWKARLSMREGRLKEAVSLLDRLVALDRLSSWAFAWRGRCRAQRGELEAARADLETAVNLHAGYGDAWAWLSDVARRLGDRAAALRHADAAVGLKGDPALAHLVRAMARAEGGDVAGQLADFRELARLAPERFNEEARRLGLDLSAIVPSSRPGLRPRRGAGRAAR